MNTSVKRQRCQTGLKMEYPTAIHKRDILISGQQIMADRFYIAHELKMVLQSSKGLKEKKRSTSSEQSEKENKTIPIIIYSKE